MEKVLKREGEDGKEDRERAGQRVRESEREGDGE